MDTRGTRRELVDSARLLVGGERRLLGGLLAGAVGYLIWIAGTGVAVEQAAEVVFGGFDAGSWTRETALVAAALGVLWVLAPSAVAVRLAVGSITNIRGNVEKRYRLDRPLVLLVPPLVALAAVLGAAFARGALDAGVLLAFGFVNVVLLVRAVAYGYRVYSLSAPRLLQVALFVAAVAVSLAVVSRTADLAGQEVLVRTVAGRYGVSDYAFGTVRIGALSAEFLPLAGATVPGALALAYVWFQILASLIVRVRRPDVPRSAIRAGQRYPQVVQPGTSRRLAMGTASKSDDSDESDEPHETDEADDAADESTPGDGGPDGAAAGRTGDSEEATADAGDDIGRQTRVFRPSEDADDAVEERAVVGETSKSELCPICGATYDAGDDPTHCPNCNAVLDE